MNDDERVEQIVKVFFGDKVLIDVSMVRSRTSAILAEVRREAYEECAKICDDTTESGEFYAYSIKLEAKKIK